MSTGNVDHTHELFDLLIETWELVRDCFDGSRGVKGAHSERYLPRLARQGDDDYLPYKKRAVFFNSVKRTVQAMIGFVFRQDPEFKVPSNPPMAEFMRDCTLTGKSFYDYSKETVGEVFKVGGRGTLIDWEVTSDRAFLIGYKREDIINWRYEDINGQSTLALLVLREESSQWIRLADTDKEPDKFSTCTYTQMRVYTLEQDDSGGWYALVTVYREKSQKPPKEQKPAPTPINAASLPTEWVVVDQKIPMRALKSLTRIPFVPHGPEVNELDPGEIPMEPIADLNVAHYRNSADYENALHVAGVPTPVFCGFDFSDKGPNEPVLMGARKGIVSDNPNAKAEFLAYNASDAGAIVAAMDKKEQHMAAQGARILEKQTSGRGTEAFQTVQLRQGADTSALMTMTIASTQSLSDVLQWVVWWNDRSVEEPEDLDEKVTCALNTEFISLVMESGMLHELTASYLQGALTLEEYFNKLQEGGIVRSETSLEQYRKDLANHPANLPVAPVGPDGNPIPQPNPNAPPPKAKPPKLPAGGA